MANDSTQPDIPQDLRELYADVQRVIAGTTQTMLEKEVQTLIERIAALERKLASLDWSRITPENLPCVGDEFLLNAGSSNDVGKVERNTRMPEWTFQEWRTYGATHRRPINPPSHPASKEGK